MAISYYGAVSPGNTLLGRRVRIHGGSPPPIRIPHPALRTFKGIGRSFCHLTQQVSISAGIDQ